MAIDTHTSVEAILVFATLQMGRLKTVYRASTFNTITFW